MDKFTYWTTIGGSGELALTITREDLLGGFDVARQLLAESLTMKRVVVGEKSPVEVPVTPVKVESTLALLEIANQVLDAAPVGIWDCHGGKKLPITWAMEDIGPKHVAFQKASETPEISDLVRPYMRVKDEICLCDGTIPLVATQRRNVFDLMILPNADDASNVALRAPGLALAAQVTDLYINMLRRAQENANIKDGYIANRTIVSSVLLSRASLVALR